LQRKVGIALAQAQTPSGQVDIHSHILPHIDDGARDVDEALDMLRMARQDGTSAIVATPHSDRATPEHIRIATQSLRSEAQAANLRIDILVGCEVKFSADLASDYREGRLLTINDGPYALVEFSFRHAWTSLVHTSLYALQMAGATPVIAHAERYPAVQENPGILLEFIGMGIPIQINAGSLLGTDGIENQRTAELLVNAGMVHLLASDGHRRDQRKPLLKASFDRLGELTGADVVHRVEQNAVRIINERTINLPEPDASALKPPSYLNRVLGKFRR